MNTEGFTKGQRVRHGITGAAGIVAETSLGSNKVNCQWDGGTSWCSEGHLVPESCLNAPREAKADIGVGTTGVYIWSIQRSAWVRVAVLEEINHPAASGLKDVVRAALNIYPSARPPMLLDYGAGIEPPKEIRPESV